MEDVGRDPEAVGSKEENEEAIVGNTYFVQHCYPPLYTAEKRRRDSVVATHKKRHADCVHYL